MYKYINRVIARNGKYARSTKIYLAVERAEEPVPKFALVLLSARSICRVRRPRKYLKKEQQSHSDAP